MKDTKVEKSMNSLNREEFLRSSRRFRDWVADLSLPIWLADGLDSKTNGHVERLDAKGAQDNSAGVRMRVQSRQLFVFSCATFNDWCDATTQAEKLAVFIDGQRDGCHYPNRLDSQFRPVEFQEDIYDYAFHLLSCAWYYKAFGDDRRLAHAYELFDHIDQHYASVDGGWLEGNFEAKYRRQNPHMHLFEAFLALYEASGDSLWLSRAKSVVKLFESVFFNDQYGVLLEYFESDWGLLDDENRSYTEPGHMYEWVWLLAKYQTLSGENVAQLIVKLYAAAQALVADPVSPIIDSLVVETGVSSVTKRCWPMTEAIKAHVAVTMLGLNESAGHASEAIKGLMHHFLVGRFDGMYIDQLGENNQVISDVMPASTMYHLLVAALEADALAAHFVEVDGKREKTSNSL